MAGLLKSHSCGRDLGAISHVSPSKRPSFCHSKPGHIHLSLVPHTCRQQSKVFKSKSSDTGSELSCLLACAGRVGVTLTCCNSDMVLKENEDIQSQIMFAKCECNNYRNSKFHKQYDNACVDIFVCYILYAS